MNSVNEDYCKSEKSVSIIIPVYNQIHFTKKCVESIKLNTRESYEIIVIDNASDDGTDEYLRDEGIKTITNNENLGFPAAINQGIKASVGEYICLLNNDIEVLDGWLEPLMEEASKKDIASAGPLQVDAEGNIWHCGTLFYQDGTEYARVPYHEYMGFPAEESFFGPSVRYPSMNMGCAIMRSEVFADVGLLDEETYEFPGNYEDVDWMLRARKKGLSHVFVPSSKIIHYGSKTQNDLNENRNGIANSALHKNLRKFLDKWKSEPRWLFEQEMPTCSSTESISVKSCYSIDDTKTIKLNDEFLNRSLIEKRMRSLARKVSNPLNEITVFIHGDNEKSLHESFFDFLKGINPNCVYAIYVNPSMRETLRSSVKTKAPLLYFNNLGDALLDAKAKGFLTYNSMSLFLRTDSVAPRHSEKRLSDLSLRRNAIVMPVSNRGESEQLVEYYGENCGSSFKKFCSDLSYSNSGQVETVSFLSDFFTTVPNHVLIESMASRDSSFKKGPLQALFLTSVKRAVPFMVAHDCFVYQNDYREEKLVARMSEEDTENLVGLECEFIESLIENNMTEEATGALADLENIRIVTNSIIPISRLIKAFSDIGEIETALRLSGFLGKRFPENPSILTDQAALLYALEDYSLCEEKLKKALSIDGGFVPALISLSELYIQADMHDNALLICEDLIESFRSGLIQDERIERFINRLIDISFVLEKRNSRKPANYEKHHLPSVAILIFASSENHLSESLYNSISNQDDVRIFMVMPESLKGSFDSSSIADKDAFFFEQGKAEMSFEEINCDWTMILKPNTLIEKSALRKVVEFAAANNLELVYGKLSHEASDGSVYETGTDSPKKETFSLNASLLRGDLSDFILSKTVGDSVDDWNVLLRSLDAGISIGFIDEILASVVIPSEKAEDEKRDDVFIRTRRLGFEV